MTPSDSIAVATHSRHRAAQIDRIMKCVGLSAVAVEPTTKAIVDRLGGSEAGVVVLDATQRNLDALALAKELGSTLPQVKVVILGASADLQMVARAILAKASLFLVDNMPVDEVGKSMQDLLAGRQPGKQCLYGRVWTELPVPTGEKESFRTPSGRQLTLKEAIKQCDQFGLSADEIADYLQVLPDAVGQVTSEARKVLRPSLLSRILALMLPDLGSGSVGLPITRSMLMVLALCVALAAAISLVRQRPSLDQFVPLKGTAAYDNGKPLGSDTALVFGLLSSDTTRAPLYSGAARIIGSKGEFATVVRLPLNYNPPFSFSVAVVDRSLMPLEDADIAAACSDLSTTPIRVTAAGGDVQIRCPKP